MGANDFTEASLIFVISTKDFSTHQTAVSPNLR